MRRQEAGQAAQVGIDQVLDAPLADAAQVGDGRGQQVGGQRDRLGVEVAAGEHLAGVGEDQRIVGGRVHLALDDAR